MTEPSNGELARRLDEITRLLQGHVARPEYTEYQRYLDHRFSESERDLAEVRRVHAEDIRAMQTLITELRTLIENSAKQRGLDWRQFLYAGVVPFLIGMLAVLTTVWAHKGGK